MFKKIAWTIIIAVLILGFLTIKINADLDKYKFEKNATSLLKYASLKIPTVVAGTKVTFNSDSGESEGSFYIRYSDKLPRELQQKKPFVAEVSKSLKAKVALETNKLFKNEVVKSSKYNYTFSQLAKKLKSGDIGICVKAKLSPLSGKFEDEAFDDARLIYYKGVFYYKNTSVDQVASVTYKAQIVKSAIIWFNH
ncbi:MAG: hypothetical protein ABIJ91_01940 [Candidatus Kuenenbacteria bacterium]